MAKLNMHMLWRLGDICKNFLNAVLEETAETTQTTLVTGKVAEVLAGLYNGILYKVSKQELHMQSKIL